MRILFLALDISLASLTGDTIHVKELIKSLSRLGNEVVLVVPSGNNVEAEKERLESFGNVTVHFNKNRNLLNTVKFCKKVIETHVPEVIYERRFSAKVGAALSIFSKVPLVIEINGLIEEEIEITDGSKRTPTVISVTKKNMRKRFFKRATRIVAVTEGIRNALVRQYNIRPQKIDVVPNGADVDTFRPLGQDSCRSELGFETGKKHIVFVGKLVPWQGVDNLLRAIPTVLEDEPDARVLIVGDGKSLNDLKDLAKELGIENKVAFTGSVPYEEVPKYINAADVCVALKRSMESGFSSLKLYEYMACGRPIVASDVPGFGILRDSNCGLLVNPDDRGDVAKAILTILKNDEMGKEMGRNGRAIAVKDYSWDATAKKVMAICEAAK